VNLTPPCLAPRRRVSLERALRRILYAAKDHNSYASFLEMLARQRQLIGARGAAFTSTDCR